MSGKEGVFDIIDETRNAIRGNNLIPLKRTGKSAKKQNTKKKKEVGGILRQKKSLLSDAISDINREIANIGLQKKKINEQISSADKGLELSREAEKKLQEKIAQLIAKETVLKDRKKKITLEGENLSEKLSKIQKVKSELSDI